MKKKEPISRGSEWTFELIQQYEQEIGRLAKDFGLSTYPNQIEIISSEQMMDAYASTGMPIGYHHWSFGKHFVQVEKRYKHGQMGLAYEMVINSNPAIAYLMEENSMMMQALVIAHACYGHNSFFKNNYLFRAWTNADVIIDYLLFAKSYIAQCEEKHGINAVEEILDACHALMNYGVDRYKRPPQLSMREEEIRQKKRQEYMRLQINDLWRTIPVSHKKNHLQKQKRFPKEPEENLLYFVEKNAPLLEPWQREIVRIVRKIAQYFYPQRQTKVMNEGWATFWHYTLMLALYEEKLVTDEFMIEFFQSHTNVIFQPEFDSPYYSGINPYTLGYSIFSDLRRICENPTEEDKQWFPDIANQNWLSVLDFAMRNFKDESFIAQYLSPNVIRNLHLFSVLNDETEENLLVSAIHNEDGYRHVRKALSENYNLSLTEPNIQVFNVDLKGDRSLILRHIEYQNRPMGNTTQQVLKYLHQLWGFPVKLETVTSEGTVKAVYEYPQKN